MSLWEALILGIVQGIAEFFPISSSAHLTIIEALFGTKELQGMLFFDLTCHLGTALATILFLRKDIYTILFKDREKIWMILLALLPLFPAYFFLKPVITRFFSLNYLGFSLMGTAAILFLTSYHNIRPKQNSSLNAKIKDVLCIGCMQALALIPGLSRSGFTISAAYLNGWKIENAIRFSFLLAIPAILGGSFLETIKLFSLKIAPSLPLYIYLCGFLTSFVTGFGAIRFIFSIRENRKLRPFAWYCLFIGILATLYLKIFHNT